jgi:hypothetical protein
VNALHRLSGLLLVREHERGPVLHYVLLFFLLGAGLALGRGSVDALFLKRFGFEYLPLMYGALSVFMASLSLGYAAWVDRLPSERFFQILLGLLAAILAGCWALMQFEGMTGVYPFYFLLYELASELLLLHATLYMGQNLETQQLKRLSPLIFAGAQAGTMSGGLFLALSARTLGVSNMLLVWMALIGACTVLLYRRHARVGISPFFSPGRKGRGGLRQSIDQVVTGVRFFRRSELARASSFALFFMVMAFFILSYSVSRIYAQAFPDADALGSFYGWLTASTSALALVIQLFVTNRLLQRLGVKRVNFVFPTAALLSYAALLASFTLPSAILASITKDAINPAVRRPARNLYQNALQESMQGRIRALSVALVMPAALLAVSVLLALAQSSFQPVYFLTAGLAACLLYGYFKMRVNRAYDSTLMATLRERLFLPRQALAEITADGGHELYRELLRGAQSPDEDVSLAYARLLADAFPQRAAPVILGRAEAGSIAFRDSLLQVLAGCRGDLSGPLVKLLDRVEDDHLRATLLEMLIARREPLARARVASCLAAANPRWVAAGIKGVYSYELVELEPEAMRQWERLLTSATPSDLIAGLQLFAHHPQSALRRHLPRLLAHEAAPVREAALGALAQLPVGALPDAPALLARLYGTGDVAIRAACVRSYRTLPQETRRTLCFEALADAHPLVREAALALLLDGVAIEASEMVEWLSGNRGSPRAQRAALEALSQRQAPRELFVRLAEAKVRDAETYAGILAQLVREHPAPDNAERLLRILLEERRVQMIDLALAAMASLENPLDVATIRAGLASADRRFRGQAAEALRSLANRKLAERLGRLLDGAAGPATAFASSREALAWLGQRADSWLRDCARHAAGASP